MVIIVIAVVLLSVRVTAILICLVQHLENQARTRLQERSERSERSDVEPQEPAQDEATVGAGPQDAAVWPPQDAVCCGPRDAAGRPQDAPVARHPLPSGPQDAVVTEPADEPVVRPGTSAQDRPAPEDLTVDLAVVLVCLVQVYRRAVRDVTAGHRAWLLRFGIDGPGHPVADAGTAETAAVPDTGSQALVPRPAGGPAYLGGRDDGIYLRGWDDAIDCLDRGNDLAGATWGDVAYMTGWNDAFRAVARAERLVDA